mmetsp:Transcript_27570/g.53562  ORF Transcript_27570/g.53562 Transcript_27570/m.53562 type:complete len:198 (+) Transcript_27570:334-927(+)
MCMMMMMLMLMLMRMMHTLVFAPACMHAFTVFSTRWYFGTRGKKSTKTHPAVYNQTTSPSSTSPFVTPSPTEPRKEPTRAPTTPSPFTGTCCITTAEDDKKEKSCDYLNTQLASRVWSPCGDCLGKQLINTYLQILGCAERPIYESLMNTPPYFKYRCEFPSCGLSADGDTTLGEKETQNSAAANMSLGIAQEYCGK